MERAYGAACQQLDGSRQIIDRLSGKSLPNPNMSRCTGGCGQTIAERKNLWHEAAKRLLYSGAEFFNSVPFSMNHPSSAEETAPAHSQAHVDGGN